ncbi:hypothetical protein BGZ52_007313, partial [Haplosporangium bisporale]
RDDLHPSEVQRPSCPGSHRHHTRPGPEHPVATLLAPHSGCLLVLLPLHMHPKLPQVHPQ